MCNPLTETLLKSETSCKEHTIHLSMIPANSKSTISLFSLEISCMTMIEKVVFAKTKPMSRKVPTLV